MHWNVIKWCSISPERKIRKETIILLFSNTQ
jgi:hypothetical protein